MCQKAELVCKMCIVRHLGHIIPLRLLSGGFVVYQQLGEDKRADINQMKSTLSTHFAMDGFVVYELLTEQQLCYRESVDILGGVAKTSSIIQQNV